MRCCVQKTFRGYVGKRIRAAFEADPSKNKALTEVKAIQKFLYLKQVLLASDFLKMREE